MQTRSYRTLLSALASILSLSASASAAATSEGCYVADTLTSLGTYQYQSEGYCLEQCTELGYAVFGMTDGNVCACGNSLPTTPAAASDCDTACVGYPSDTCGGTGYYSVWLTGVGTLSGSSASASTTAGTTTTTKKATTTAAGTSTTTAAQAAPSIVYVTTAIVQQGVTIVQTVSASTTTPKTSTSASSSASASASKKSSSISGGAIAGIVVGALAAVSLGAGLFFLFYRRRTNKEDEFGGEYKRHIEAGGAGHTQSPSPSLVDNRLDTSLAIRRNSSESLADNQDYSRKILRVVN